MDTIWYLIPGNRDCESAYLLALEVGAHLDRAGICFSIPERAAALPHTAEAIARAIIRAAGREFVPATPGECTEEAVKLGLFPRNTRWKDPLTKEEAAILAVKLKKLLDRG